jgi:cellulose synthase (UDP-forming)
MLASGASFISLMISQILFIGLAPWLVVFVPLFSFSIAYYVISLAVNVGTPSFDLAAHDRLVSEARGMPAPSVDVFLPVCGEAPEILRNTWHHVAQLVDGYRGVVRVYVLDDSPTDDGLRTLAESFGFKHVRRQLRGWYKKAGNLRNGYRRTVGDLILVLDADFAPRSDLLDELTPYFVVDPTVGVVQSPQYFRVLPHQGWLERGAGAVQELFYRMIQTSRQSHEASICVGSCALYRRAALDDIGGSTLIEHSEDVHTGFDLRRRGWRLSYIPLPLATGLCPADRGSFFTQQYRWCSGSMSLLGSTKFWNAGMPVRARLSYLSGFCYYLHTAVFTIVGPMVPLVMLIVFPDHIRLINYLLIAPSLIYNLAVVPSWHRCRYRVEVWTTKLLSGWAHLWAVWDIVTNRRMGWQPTGGTARKHRTMRLWAGLAIWTVGTGIAWVGVAGVRMIDTDPLAFGPAFALGGFYLTIALQALLVDPVREAGMSTAVDPAAGTTAMTAAVARTRS